MRGGVEGVGGMNPKDQLAEIEKGCGKCNYICHKCKGKLSEDIMGKKCPYCSEWTYYCNEFKGLCNECQTAKRYFLLGTISQLKIRLEELEPYIYFMDVSNEDNTKTSEIKLKLIKEG